MKIIVDTNVLVSAVFFGGVPGHILSAWRDATIQIVTSPEILEEYSIVLERLSSRYPTVDSSKVFSLVARHSECTISPSLPKPLCEDPDDDKFFACALAAGVKIIVSGDGHLLRQNGYCDIEVLRAADFVTKYLESD